jgi:D-alanyl-D-alanine carboxypeptidase/D-alanyl-D-alanine-endopeptidase (penicillin-binding protein 4)
VEAVRKDSADLVFSARHRGTLALSDAAWAGPYTEQPLDAAGKRVRSARVSFDVKLKDLTTAFKPGDVVLVETAAPEAPKPARKPARKRRKGEAEAESVTAAAALLTLDRNARVTTVVQAADQTRMPGVVVLVGGGDPVLSAAPPREESWYRDAARISDLADQVRDSGITVTAVQVDNSLYTGPDMAPGWDPADIAGGDISPVQSVMLDAGRIQPTTVESRRSPTPALDAGRALAVALGVDLAKVTMAPGPAGGRQLASVQSAPLIERVRQMMVASDNVMAETIAREVAQATGRPLSFAGGVDAVLAKLAAADIDLTGASLVDSSGLSVANLLTANTLDEVINAAAGPDQPALRPMMDMLAVAGGSGTLSDRFLGVDPKKSSAGWLRAKTGSLTKTNSLAGIVTDVNGRVLSFAFISNNAGMEGRTRLDALAGILRTCGCGS